MEERHRGGGAPETSPHIPANRACSERRSRRQFVRRTSAAGALVLGAYVTPTLRTLNIPLMVAVSGQPVSDPPALPAPAPPPIADGATPASAPIPAAMPRTGAGGASAILDATPARRESR